jgi:nitrous oxidase accessory protein NosD
VSYTLRGRLESRLASALPALAVALALHAWWPLELVAVMLAAGLFLDAVAYDRLLPYQPGWVAVPLGAVELAAVMGLALLVGVHAPLGPAVALFTVAWLLAQVLGHAVFPRLRISYAEDGGELGRGGAVAALVVAAVLVGSAGFAYASRPPTVHLRAGVHQGPLVVDRRETLVGDRGAIVRGGIVVRANDVTVRNVIVSGGSNGIDVENALRVKLDNVSVVGSSLDAIHVRRSTVDIRDCSIAAPAGPWTQGIDISFGIDLPMSMIMGCTISGVREGIVVHSSNIEVSDNHVSDTRLRAIDIAEMSMGTVHGNDVQGALGVGILCVDHSMCQIDRNVVAGTRPDRSADDLSRAGYGIEAHYDAEATLEGNTIVSSPGGVGAFAGATIEHRR